MVLDETFASTLKGVGQSLEHLYLHNVVNEDADLPDLPDELPNLITITLSGAEVSPVAQLLTSTRLPRLRQAHFTIDMWADPLETSHRLEALNALEAMLSQRKIYHTFHVEFEDGLHNYQSRFQLFAPLASTGLLRMTARLSGLYLPEQLPSSLDLEDDEDDDFVPDLFLDTLLLQQLISKPLLSSLHEIRIMIQPSTKSRPGIAAPVMLENLEKLEIVFTANTRKWNSMIAHQLLTCMHMPKLRHLNIKDYAFLPTAGTYLTSLEVCLPLWPSLGRIYICIPDDAQVARREDFDSLQRACQARSIKLTISSKPKDALLGPVLPILQAS